MTRLRSADGQVTVMAAVLMVFLVAMVAFVLDVGSWFRQQRISQSTVDAAALAGAQALPNDPGSATTLASTFANKNGGVLGATITIGSKWNPNDMITVKQTKSATGFFSKVLGINDGLRAREGDRGRRDPDPDARHRTDHRQHPAPAALRRRLPVLQRADDAAARQDRRAGRVRAARPRQHRSERHGRREHARRAGSRRATTTTCRSASTSPTRARSGTTRSSRTP